MGTDKALLPWDSSTLAEHLSRELEAVCSKVVWVGDPEKYSTLHPDVIADLHPGEGPLEGIRSAFLLTSSPALLICPCDSPLVNREVFASLLASLKPGDRWVCIGNEDGIQPLCAWISADILPELEVFLRDGKRKVTEFFHRVNGRIINVTQTYLQNVNSPAEFAAASGRVAVISPAGTVVFYPWSPGITFRALQLQGRFRRNGNEISEDEVLHPGDELIGIKE